MKLLIVTQAVDTEDPVLGFFAGWITELSKHAERIEVVCLKEGKHELPQNVRVHSLGKERGPASRVVYAWRFFRLAWQLRGSYDAAFVHMNQEYILIAGWLWKLLGKRVYLWRNHYAGSWLTDVAAAFCTKVFCTSQYSYTAKYAKTILMPVGIDTDLFKPKGDRAPRSILFLARMAPSKHPDILIEALGLLKKKGVMFTASFYGSPALGDEQYYTQLKYRAEELELSSEVRFHAAVRNADTPEIYAAHEICVNLSPNGMYDKTIFEAAAAGCLSLTSNKNLEGHVGAKLLFDEGNAKDLSGKLEALLNGTEKEKLSMGAELRTLVQKQHSLALLGTQLARSLRSREAVLVQNGSLGDFLLFVHLAERLMQSDRFFRATIVVPRNAAPLRSLIALYPYLSVQEVSLHNWRPVFGLLSGAKTIIVHPTIGRIPLRLKLLVWLLSRGSGSESIGFQDAGPLCSLYTRTLSYDTAKPYLSTIIELAEAGGGSGDTEPPRLLFSESEAVLQTYDIAHKPYLVFHPGASNPKRMFTREAATELVRFVLDSHPSVSILLTGEGADERDLIATVVRATDSERVISAVDLPLADIAALVKRSALFIGTDTGITHLACFLGTRVIEVAHNATANWLAFYAPNATVLYKIEGDSAVHTQQDYLAQHAPGILRPFTTVPVAAVCEAVSEQLRQTV